MDTSKKISADTEKIYTSILSYFVVFALLSISIWEPFRGYYIGILLLIPLVDLNKKILCLEFLLIISFSLYIIISLLIYNPTLFEHFRYVGFLYFLFIINNLKNIYLNKIIIKKGIYVSLFICTVNLIYFILYDNQITFIEKGPLGQYIALCLILLYILERNKLSIYISLLLNILLTSLRGFGVSLLILFSEIKTTYKIIFLSLFIFILLVSPNFIGIQARIDTALAAIYQEHNSFVGRYAALYMLTEFFSYDYFKILFGHGAGSYNDLRYMNMDTYLDYDYPGIIIIEILISLGIVGTILFILSLINIFEFHITTLWILFNSLAASIHDPIFWMSSIILLLIEKNSTRVNR